MEEVYIMTSTLRISLDDDIKKKSDRLFKSLGTDTTTAIRMFLIQSIANNGFPFEIRQKNNAMYALSEEELFDKLEESREHIRQGKARNADDVIMDIRGKYGL